ncbi:MAG: amidase [Actinomycetota bacterium]|nr:amidase [Actinomycetota bacterium]
MPDLADLTAVQQAAAVRDGAVSPVELVEHYLDRIERLDPAVGAFVTVTADAAREQAAAAERRLASGAELPPLFGVPIAIKDLNSTAGVRTTFGSAVYAGHVPAYDDFVVGKLKAAGTICVGKTNAPEFGLPCYTEPDVAPAARTPWDLRRSAGGSSGGAAAAVAAGLVPFAHGSDGGGSIRIPASVCGLVGLKTSRGRVSNGPVMADVTGLAVQGPLARTVRDAAALLDAMSGPMPGDPHWANPPSEPYTVAVERPVGRLRIGRYATPIDASIPVAPECIDAYDEATKVLLALGHEVEDVPPPFRPEVIDQFLDVWAVAACMTPVPAGAEPLLRPLTRWLRERGRAVSGPGFATSLAGMQRQSRAAISATAGFDAVLTPTLAQPPALVGELRDDSDPERDFNRQFGFTPFTAAYNVTGQPAISLPLWRTSAGLPIGVMLAGRPAGEELLLRLAAQIEDAVGGWARTPELGSS